MLFGGEQNDLNGSRKLSKEEKKNILATINLGIKGANNLILATLDGNENQTSSLFHSFLQNKDLQVVKAPLSYYVSFAVFGYLPLTVGG